MIPGLTTVNLAHMPERPGMGAPMRASGIIEALEETLSVRKGSKIDDALFVSVRYDLRKILEHQSAVRGLPGPERSLWDVIINVDDRNALVIVCGQGWIPAVDHHLMNHDCSRCGGLRTAGFVHTKDDCDLILARCVLDG